MNIFKMIIVMMIKLVNVLKVNSQFIVTLVTLATSVFAYFSLIQNANVLKATLEDNNRPLLIIEGDYDFHEINENSVENIDYSFSISGVTLNEKNVKNINCYSKTYDYIFKLKNIGRGIAKNLTLYDINCTELEEIFINNNANKFGDYKSVKNTIILNNDEEIQISAKVSCQLSKNTKDSFIGLLFYQDIYDNLYGALLCLEVLIDTNNIAFGSINYFNADMYGYKKKIAEMINNIYRREKVVNNNINEANKKAIINTNELINKIENTIKLKKNEIKEYDKFLKNKIMIE